MPERANDLENQNLTRPIATHEQNSPEITEQKSVVTPPKAASMLSSGKIAQAQRIELVQSVAQNFGNQAVQRMLSNIQRETAEEEVGSVSKSAGREGGPLEGNIGSMFEQASRSSSSSLPDGVQRELTQKTGMDASQVKVVDGSQVNPLVGAKHSTVGGTVFASPNASDADLKHEGLHAVEQIQSGQTEINASSLSVGNAETDAEHRAEEFAEGH